MQHVTSRVTADSNQRPKYSPFFIFHLRFAICHKFVIEDSPLLIEQSNRTIMMNYGK
jgi:hypothetical protein